MIVINSEIGRSDLTPGKPSTWFSDYTLAKFGSDYRFNAFHYMIYNGGAVYTIAQFMGSSTGALNFDFYGYLVRGVIPRNKRPNFKLIPDQEYPILDYGAVTSYGPRELLRWPDTRPDASPSIRACNILQKLQPDQTYTPMVRQTGHRTIETTVFPLYFGFERSDWLVPLEDAYDCEARNREELDRIRLSAVTLPTVFSSKRRLGKIQQRTLRIDDLCDRQNFGPRLTHVFDRCTFVKPVAGGVYVCLERHEGVHYYPNPTVPGAIMNLSCVLSSDALRRAEVIDIAPSPTGNTIAVVVAQKGETFLRVYSRSGNLITEFNFPAHRIQFSPDGATLAVGYTDVWRHGYSKITLRIVDMEE
jgi:hypothetical protein